jgi:hypothetical protein
VQHDGRGNPAGSPADATRRFEARQEGVAQEGRIAGIQAFQASGSMSEILVEVLVRIEAAMHPLPADVMA